MRKLLMGLAAVPFWVGMAVAGQPLTDQQMDRVTAGFTSISVADAEGLVPKGNLLLTTTASLSQVTQFASAIVGEVTVTAMKSLAGAQSSSISTAIPTVPLVQPAP